MAQAIVNRIADSYHDVNGYHLTLDIAFAGADVSSGFKNAPVDVVFTGSQTVNQINTAVAAAIRSAATGFGFTVIASGIYCPFTFQLL